MDGKQFRHAGAQMIDYCADFMDTLRKRDCIPNCDPGYLAKMLPKDAPEHPEPWDAIFKDIEPCIQFGMAHWQHPHFHAYFPAGNSWPSIIGDIFSNGVAVNGATWNSCPALTELEMIVTDWCAKFLDLPPFFQSKISNPQSVGGGALQCSASEAIFFSMLCARQRGVRKVQALHPDKTRAQCLYALRGYASSCSHSSVDKGSMMANIHLRFLDPSDRGTVRAMTLEAACEDDRKKGFYPFFYSSILGSTSTCAFDDIEEIGPVATVNDLWLHVDGAYAGSSFACPELRYLKSGLEYAWSFNTNCNKWMLTNFDCSLHWMRYRDEITDLTTGFNVTDFSMDVNQKVHDMYLTDYCHWGVPLERRFRAFKLWMVIRTYGVEGLRQYVRTHIHLAKLFEKFVHRDPRFEVVGEVRVGLCCFRLRGPNIITEQLLEQLNSSRRIHMIPSKFHEKYVIRFALCAEATLDSDIEYAWDVISEFATIIIEKYKNEHKDSEDAKELMKAEAQYMIAQETKKKSKELLEIAAMASQKIQQGVRKDDYLVNATSKLGDKFYEEVEENDADEWIKDAAGIKVEAGLQKQSMQKQSMQKQSMQQSMCIIS